MICVLHALRILAGVDVTATGTSDCDAHMKVVHYDIDDAIKTVSCRTF